MRLNGDWHGWGLTILLVAAFSLYKWAQAFRQCHPFLQFCSSYARSTIEHFCNQANCWHPNIHPFNLLWPPFLRRCMESTCWFPNLSHFSHKLLLDNLSRKGCQPSTGRFYSSDVANIGIGPDVLAQPSGLWYHSTIIDDVWNIFPWRNEEIDVACIWLFWIGWLLLSLWQKARYTNSPKLNFSFWMAKKIASSLSCIVLCFLDGGSTA